MNTSSQFKQKVMSSFHVCQSDVGRIHVSRFKYMLKWYGCLLPSQSVKKNKNLKLRISIALPKSYAGMQVTNETVLSKTHV